MKWNWKWGSGDVPYLSTYFSVYMNNKIVLIRRDLSSFVLLTYSLSGFTWILVCDMIPQWRITNRSVTPYIHICILQRLQFNPNTKNLFLLAIQLTHMERVYESYPAFSQDFFKCSWVTGRILINWCFSTCLFTTNLLQVFNKYKNR